MHTSKQTIISQFFILFLSGSFLFSPHLSQMRQQIDHTTISKQQIHLSENALVLALAGSSYFAIHPVAVVEVIHRIQDIVSSSSMGLGLTELGILFGIFGIVSSPPDVSKTSPTLEAIQDINNQLFYFLKNSAPETLFILNNHQLKIPNYLNTFGYDYRLAWIFDPQTRKIRYLTQNISWVVRNQTPTLTMLDLVSGSLINFLHTIGHVIDANKGVSSEIDRKELLDNYSLEIEAISEERYELMSRMADIRADVYAIPTIRSFSAQQRESAISYYKTRWTNIFERSELGLSKADLIYFTYQYYFWTCLGYTEITDEMNKHVVDKLINDYPDIHQKFERHLRFFSNYQKYLQRNPTWTSQYPLAAAT